MAEAIYAVWEAYPDDPPVRMADFATRELAENYIERYTEGDKDWAEAFSIAVE